RRLVHRGRECQCESPPFAPPHVYARQEGQTCRLLRRSATAGSEDIIHAAMATRAHDALRTILPIAGWGDERARDVEITGDADPILPTPFRIGETSAAALAAVGLAASELWEQRTGRRQQIAVDTRQATASLRSTHYMKMDGASVSTERNTVMGTYPAKNGRWSYLNCNF